MKTFKVWQVLVSIVCLALIALVLYGVNTDCPNTAGYVYCGEGKDWSLQKWSLQKSNE